MVDFSVVVEEVEQDVAKIYVLRNSHLREIPELDEGDDHQEKPVRAESSFVRVVQSVDSQHLLENQDERLYEPAIKEIRFNKPNAFQAVVELSHVSNVQVEALAVNRCVLWIFRVLVTR